MSAIFSRRENSPLPCPFQQCPQVDGCARQRDGLRVRLSTPRFSRRENMGFAVAGRLIGKAHELERKNDG